MTQYQTLYLLIKELMAYSVHDKPQFYLVGGCVRDAIIHNTFGYPNFENDSIKDFDVECFHITPFSLESRLTYLGAKVDKVGEAFGVFKVTYKGGTFDFSFPRTEIKSGEGYKGFDVSVDPFMTVEEAASRRDLTINAIYYDVTMDELIDPYDGVIDIHNGILRACSDRFAEDPLRVLRAFQFSARFGFRANYELSKMCQKLLIEKDTLVKERVWVEWEKWCTKALTPSKGLWFLMGCNWLDIELSDLLAIEQDPIWHPEGTCFMHTCHVVNEARDIATREGLDKDDTIILMLAALCHDFGKSTTTIFDDGRWKAPGHAEAGVSIAAGFLEKIGCPVKYVAPILTLVKEHMSHLGAITPRVCRRLVNRLVEGGTSLRMLSLVVEADMSGRPPLPKGMPENMIELLRIAEDSGIDGSVTIPRWVMGRDLIKLGVVPGPGMGIILDQVYQKQLDWDFETIDEALTFTKTLI